MKRSIYIAALALVPLLGIANDAETAQGFIALEADESAGLVAEIAGQFGVSLQTLVAQVVNFLIVAIALYFFAVKPVVATLDQRQKTIADGLQYAEDMKVQLAKAEQERAETIKKATLEAQRILAEARDQAKDLLDRKTNEAAAKAESIIHKAHEAIDVERNKMLSEVRQEVARLVVATSGKVLSRELSDQERSRFGEVAARELAQQNN
jgi:F-type H+-transporting ATPase subunit b